MYNISWNEFEKLSVDLAKQIKLSNHKFDYIVGISRGGLLLSRLLSEILNLPLGIISAKTVAGKYIVDTRVSGIKPPIGNILLVDDIFEQTAYEIKDVLIKYYSNIKNIQLACVFYRSKTDFKPEFYINHINNVKEEFWISFPYQNKSLKKHADL